MSSLRSVETANVGTSEREEKQANQGCEGGPPAKPPPGPPDELPASTTAGSTAGVRLELEDDDPGPGPNIEPGLCRLTVAWKGAP